MKHFWSFLILYQPWPLPSSLCLDDQVVHRHQHLVRVVWETSIDGGISNQWHLLSNGGFMSWGHITPRKDSKLFFSFFFMLLMVQPFFTMVCFSGCFPAWWNHHVICPRNFTCQKLSTRPQVNIRPRSDTAIVCASACRWGISIRQVVWFVMWYV